MEELARAILEYAGIIKFIVVFAALLIFYLVLVLGRIWHYSKLQKKELTTLNHNIIKLMNSGVALGIHKQ
jgi:hypothetical protein